MHDKNTQPDAVSHNADHVERKAAIQERARMAIEGRGYKVRYDRTTDGAECGSRGVSAQKKASLVEIGPRTIVDGRVYARGVQI